MYTEDNRDFDDYDDNNEEKYEENNNESFPYTKLIIRILIIFACLLLAIWLISKLVNVSKTANKNDGVVYNNNVSEMKQAAEEYFFNDNNLPVNTNDIYTVSLSEMNALGKIGILNDYNNNACSTKVDESFATMTKKETYYELKIKLTCAEDSKDFIYYYDLNEEDKDNNNHNNNDDNDDNYNLNINCQTWSEWTTKKLSDKNLLVRTRTLIKGYKIVGTESTEYGPWSEWTEDIILESDNISVESKEETVVTWSDNKTTTNQVVNTDTIKVINTSVTDGGISCYNKKTETTVTGELNQNEYTKLEKEGLVISLIDSYWIKTTNGYSKVYKAIYKKTEAKKVCSNNKITTYTYQELESKNVIKYRSRTITKGLIDTHTIYTDYVEKLEEGYTKVADSDLVQYSYKDSVCK